MEKKLSNIIFTDKVIVITPTYNRRKFLPILIYQFTYQTYPKHLLSLIVLDDSDISNEDIFNNIDQELKTRITYIYDSEKKPIGKKRNILNNIAKNMNANFIVCFDDDDYYPPDKISYGLHMLKDSCLLICGSSKILIYHTNIKKLLVNGPYTNKINYGHSCNGSLIYNVNYLYNNSYNDNDTFAEERTFLRNFKVLLLQIDYLHNLICIAHSSNTINKNSTLVYSKDINLQLNNIIKDTFLLDFYTNL